MRDPILLAALKRPVLLIEGHSSRFVEEDVIMYRPDGGREIFCEKFASRSVRANPVKTLDGNGNPKISYSYVTVKVAKRKSEPPNMAGGFSCRLPSGALGNRVIERFAAGNKYIRKILRSRRATQMRFKVNPSDLKESPKDVQYLMSRQGVPHELTMQTMERSILYFPNEGRVTRYGKPTSSKITLVRKTQDGWETRERSASRDVIWTLVTEAEAQEALRKGARLIEPTF